MKTIILPQKECIREHPKPRYFLRASAGAARKGSLYGGEGKRKRFPLQPFAGEFLRHYIQIVPRFYHATPFLPRICHVFLCVSMVLSGTDHKK